MSSQPKKSSKKTKNVRPQASLKRKRGDKVNNTEVVVIDDDSDDVDPVHLQAHQKQSVRSEPSLNVGHRKRAQRPEAVEDNLLDDRKKKQSTTRHTTTSKVKLIKTESTTKTESASSHVRTPLPGYLPKTVKREAPRASTSPNKITTVHRPKDEAKNIRPIASDAFTRNLRSQKVSKFKSELSLFFPEYDEIIGNEPKQEQNTLGIKTPIAIVDTANCTNCSSSRKKKDDDPLKEYSDTLIKNLKNAQFVDFSSFEENNEAEGSKDELCEEYFKSIHKQPERAEKIIRKTEKERAEHEKDQIVRLLEGLRGNDWLKILGVNSITESTKKEFQSARKYFISGCESILAKFRSWKEAEKQMMGP